MRVEREQNFVRVCVGLMFACSRTAPCSRDSGRNARSPLANSGEKVRKSERVLEERDRAPPAAALPCVALFGHDDERRFFTRMPWSGTVAEDIGAFPGGIFGCPTFESG